MKRMQKGEFRDTELGGMLSQNEIDFIDFGCSKGGSIAFANQCFNAKHGLGIDIDRKKISIAKEAGFHAFEFDINALPNEKLVRFVIMSHFLEHVPNPRDVKNYLRKACNISREFIYIQQPYFDADGYLLRRGCKLFWSDWTGHPNRMTSLELWRLCRDIKNEGIPITYSLHAFKPIVDSSDACIHPLDTALDQHDYSSIKHPAKKATILFNNNVFRELICLITMPGCDHKKLLKKIRYDLTLIDWNGGFASEAVGF